MEDGLYKLSLFFVKKKYQIAYVGYFKDSTRKENVGSSNLFFENGILAKKGNYQNGKKDGFWTSYRNTGSVSEEVLYNEGLADKVTIFHDLPVINQRMVTVDDMVNNTFYYILYDEEGKVIRDEKVSQDFSNFAFDPDTACTFNRGWDDWKKYFSRAIKIQSRKLNKKDYGTVLMRFVVDTDGQVTDIKALSMPDSKLAEVALYALTKSPKWNPAIHNGKKVKMVMFQPFTVRNPDRSSY